MDINELIKNASCKTCCYRGNKCPTGKQKDGCCETWCGLSCTNNVTGEVVQNMTVKEMQGNDVYEIET